MNQIKDDYAKNGGEYYQNMRNDLPPHVMRGYYSLCEKEMFQKMNFTEEVRI